MTTTSIFVNPKRSVIVRVFHSGHYCEGAQVTSADNEELGRKPRELDAKALNALLAYWRDFGEEVEWCAGQCHMNALLKRGSATRFTSSSPIDPVD